MPVLVYNSLFESEDPAGRARSRRRRFAALKWGAPMSDRKPQSTQTPEGGSGQTGYAKVDSWFDIVKLEHEVLKFWTESKAFDRLREKNRGNARFSFLDGPITANNPMGVHHAWGRTYKDAYQRYHAMNGKDLRWQNGFDCQGLWVEVEVEKEHGFTTKADVEAFGIDRFVEACKERVRKYSGVQAEQSKRLGMWMDWENSYFTMSDENNYTIWSFLKKCHERGKVYRGTDVMPWSGRTGAAYSQMEVVEGRKLVAHTALFVRFPLKDRDKENLLVWTTTPWTLTSNVAAAVNVDLDYVRLRCLGDGEVYYFAAENLEFARLQRQWDERKKEKSEWVEGVPKLKTIAQIFNERGGFEIEGTVKGAELVGLRYSGPFDELEAQNEPGGYPFVREGVTESAAAVHRVIDGGRDSIGNPIVVAGEGTGIVHIAPGCGDIDHELGERENLPMIAPLDGTAAFLAPFGFLAGKNAVAAETREEILADLSAKGVLVATEQYPHIYPHCWRTGDELVFRLVDEWYIRMDWRDEIIKVVDDVHWIPAWGRDREREWLTNMRDWMISKKRYWGLALPIWVCEECDSFEVIGGRDELKERAIDGWDAFDGHTPHRPWVDQVKVKCPHCGGTASRVPDVGNPWLDAGIVPYSTVGYNEDKENWAKWIPADLVLESFPGQFRNWFYSLLALSTMMEGIAPFKTLVGYALVRDEEGNEMHKSTGNAIWFDDAADEAGADTMRWLYCRADMTANLPFGYGPLREIRGKFLNQLWNTYGFYVNYARVAGFTPTGTQAAGARSDFDCWILSKLQKTIETCRAGFEEYDIRRAARAIEAFVESLSNWYIRHNRPRFWRDPDDPDGVAAFQTLYECLSAVVRLAAPMIPFLTEAMYRNLVAAVDESAPDSVHLTDYPAPDPSVVDETLLAEMDAVIRLNRLALSARESKKIKVRQPLASLTIGPADELEAGAATRFSEMLREDLNVKRVEILAPMTASPLTYTVKANFKTLGPKLGPKMKEVAAAIGSQADALLADLRGGAESVTVTVGGAPVVVVKSDLLISATAPDDRAVAEESGTWVSFDATITQDLRIEGLMRDLLRKLQVMRKDAGLEIEDRITLRWDSESTDVCQVFERFGEQLSKELLVVGLAREAGLSEGETVKAQGQKAQVAIAKA